MSGAVRCSLALCLLFTLLVIDKHSYIYLWIDRKWDKHSYVYLWIDRKWDKHSLNFDTNPRGMSLKNGAPGHIKHAASLAYQNVWPCGHIGGHLCAVTSEERCLRAKLWRCPHELFTGNDKSVRKRRRQTRSSIALDPGRHGSGWAVRFRGFRFCVEDIFWRDRVGFRLIGFSL